jgi:hypothetical protein
MGTSFVDYKGVGFWTRDSYLATWLTALIEEVDKLPDRERWEKILIEHWRAQAIIDGGCMSVGLDEFPVDHAREKLLISLAKKALAHSKPEGYRTGQLFIDLLEGRLKTDESSPIDYL